ncbi:hypothetical protein CAC42_5239 [Sphaceloma murrayae]|uniref:Rhodopsin domain-containing protein n=1 Tax=Sphaceloma murrayae TaxID=2082308 RepID=A0A2K1QUS6_9PEZI|nr:hypothetical protein CAC42_5239 [Sphaceloma murrayae]
MSGWTQDRGEILEILMQLRICNIIAWVMLITSTIAGALRIYVRIRLLKTFGWDDATMVLAQIFFLACVIIGYLVNTWAGKTYANGVAEVSLATFTWMARWGYGMYILTVIAIKTSLALFMLRIFGPHHVWERVVIHSFTIIPATIGIIALVFVNVTCAVTFIDSCDWRRAFHLTSLSFSIANSVADLAFASLSFLILWRMTMPRAAKVSAGILFFIGTVGGLASVLRVVAYFQTGSDVLQQIRYSRWSVIEAGTCITAVCLFTLRPLFRHLRCCGSRIGSGTGSAARLSPYRASTIINRGHVAELQTHGLTLAKAKDWSSVAGKGSPQMTVLVEERADSTMSATSQVQRQI